MYKYLIVGLAVMFTVSGGYYMNKAGAGELLSNAFSKPSTNNLPPPTLESVTGVYTCDTNSGCNNKFVLLLREDQTAEMIQITNTGEGGDTVQPKDTDENHTFKRSRIVAADVSLPPIGEGLEFKDTPSSANFSPNSNETTTETLPDADSQNSKNKLDEPTLMAKEPENTSSTSVTETGGWDISVQNMLVVNFTKQGTTTYEVPQKLVVKSVEASMLSKINYTKYLYTGMVNPVFVKQD